jgi:hypothetical protein
VGICQKQSSLAEIVEHKSGQHDREPSHLNGQPSEMAHIRVHSLGARDREKGGAEHGECDTGSCVNEVGDGIVWADGGQDARGLHDTEQAKEADRDEPHQHHWPEDTADELRSLALDQEQTD